MVIFGIAEGPLIFGADAEAGVVCLGWGGEENIEPDVTWMVVGIGIEGMLASIQNHERFHFKSQRDVIARFRISGYKGQPASVIGDDLAE